MTDDKMRTAESGTFVPNSVIYNKVLDVDKRMTRIETLVTVATFVIAPVISAIVAYFIGGK